MELGLAGRVAIVAGASKGLGRGVAEALADEGVSLVINARGDEALANAVESLSGRGGKVVGYAGDVTTPEMPDALVKRAIAEFGRLDIVVTNSGGPKAKRALDLSDDEVTSAIESNLLTHVRLVRAALPHLEQGGWGRICAIASYGVVQPLPNLALSNLARSGLRAWAKTAAQDLAPRNITLNLVAPGMHRTDRITSLGDVADRLGEPADFGKVVAFLCSEPAGFVNGATIVVDGGATLAL
ncbi:MAG TPA: SDR family oxidoreductase [Acidimicrobiales bacterium]